MKEAVRDYYGNTIQQTKDLSYDACCLTDYDPVFLKALTDEVKSKQYGCGSPLPDVSAGLVILDLGCGAGADVFIAAQMVGPAGKVIGVDMTDAQLDVAKRNVAPIMDNLGYDRPNVEFIKGEIESIDLPDDSVDCVMSNCVINLSTNKTAVFKEIYRLLKPGGEFLISDIVADRRIPQKLREDAKLYSECLTGADYEGDFVRRMGAAGFLDVRYTSIRKVRDIVESVHFLSITYRGFKVELDEHCEDYGQVAVYKGSIAEKEEEYMLDTGHIFPTGDAIRICKNTADIIKQSRLAPHFHLSDEIVHLGRFDCAPTAKAQGDEGALSSCC